jgi:hypothetical protein
LKGEGLELAAGCSRVNSAGQWDSSPALGSKARCYQPFGKLLADKESSRVDWFLILTSSEAPFRR